MTTYFVYYNLHKHVFSAKDKKTGIVDKTKYSNTIYMQNCEFKVSEAGRQRVLREQRKNVHAGVLGQICDINFDIKNINFDNLIEVTYNPYKYNTFVIKKSGQPVFKATKVYLIDKKIYTKEYNEN